MSEPKQDDETTTGAGKRRRDSADISETSPEFSFTKKGKAETEGKRKTQGLSYHESN